MNNILNDAYNELYSIIEIIFKYFSKTILSEDEYTEFKSLIQYTLYTFFPELLIYYNDNNLILLKKYKVNLNYLTSEQVEDQYNKNRHNIKCISNTQKLLFNKYEHLINLPQPAQKSKEWFDMRYNMITASSCGTAIGKCKYTSIKKILLDKIGLGEPFKENENVYHGKKYEKVATMIYEEIYNTKIGEFGLIQHPYLSYIGASPDGISMSITLDNKINKLLGRMLEIKCPTRRKICTTGKIYGDITPSYYWIQCQTQLEVGELDECDFWQCNITEYKSKEDFEKDNIFHSIHTESQIYNQDENTENMIELEKKNIDIRLRRGLIIEFLPKDTSNIPKDELHIWYSKYIYPDKLLKTPLEYEKWSNNIITNIELYYPELIKDYYYNRKVYWKLNQSHNELIIRQPNWFEKNKNYFQQFWNRVLYYRNNMNEAKEDIVDQSLSNLFLLNLNTDKIPIIKKISNKLKEENKINSKIDDDPFI